MDDNEKLALLRRHEPIIRFTAGEQFLPMDAESYIRASSLWVKRPDEEPRELVAASYLTPETLAAVTHDASGTVYYLKCTEPLNASEMAARALRPAYDPAQHLEQPFVAGAGRLARVGYASRLIDALFSVSLLARGRVPGDAAAAASKTYREMLEEDDRHLYHGRVVEENGWVVLQYWFFYLYNSWRSGFNGANDHEADWEMLCIYLAPTAQGELAPEWVAFASHDYAGDDLRRRWDDPEVQKVGDHPIVFAGAGSHASYFAQGEYLTEIEIPLFAPLARVLTFVRRWWNSIDLDEDAPPEAPTRPAHNVLAVPFVDYARGDGFSIGPGQQEVWDEPRLISETTPWVQGYRGLWGLYTRDPFAGEDAPAGPMYNRDGTVRHSWYDPLGWAGLNKVAPSAELPDLVDRQQEALRERQVALRQEVQVKTAELRGLEAQASAMYDQPHLQRVSDQIQAHIQQLSHAIGQLQGDIAADEALIRALGQYGQRVSAGDLGPARAHLRRAHTPASVLDRRTSAVAELWAAVSIAVLLATFVVLFFFRPAYLVFWLVAIIALFIFIEAGMRQHFTRTTGSIAVALAVVAGLLLLYEFFWWVVGVVVLAFAVYVLVDNLRELTRRSKS